MSSKEKYFLVFKYIVIGILLVSAFIVTVNAEEIKAVHKIKELKSKSGQKFTIVVNITNKDIYCVLSGDDYWKDFTVYAKRKSRPHIKPLKNFRCICR